MLEALNVLDICSGIGGLGLALGMATGGRARTVCYVEREAYAAAVLLARMEDEALGRAPIWDDLTTFDARPWRGVVDCVVAGFPCQPWSCAGKRAGIEDARWLWPDIARIVGECAPAIAFFENVPGLYRHGLRAVLSDLAALGFDAEWGDLSACAVGAPHTRQRMFCLAYSNSLLGSQRLRDLLQGQGPVQGEHSFAGARAEWSARLANPSALYRDADGVSDGMDRNRAVGNSVVVRQAVVAFRALAERVNLMGMRLGEWGA